MKMKIAIYQTMWNTTKAVLNWKCMALYDYISKVGRSKNQLNSYQKKNKNQRESERKNNSKKNRDCTGTYKEK